MPPPRRGPAAGTMSLVLDRPPRAPRSHPVKLGAQAPGLAKKARRRRKDQPEHRERPDQPRRGASRGATRHAREARRRPQPRHTDMCQATTAAGCRKPGERAQHATNDGTRTGAQEHQPLSGWTSVRQEGTEPLPTTNSCRPDGQVRARRVPSPCRLRTAAVRMDECAPRNAHATPHTEPTAQQTERGHR